MQIIKTLSANVVGRDLVIGDLHGCYHLLEVLLEHLSFDPLKDRLLSVGDLVDRGPESLRCLELLHEPWFHAVLGNHEQMLLEAFTGGPLGPYWELNGGRWGTTALRDWQARHERAPALDSEQVFDLLPKIAELPYLLTVEQPGGTKVHLIHAELPPCVRPTDGDLTDPHKVLAMAKMQSKDGDFLIWGRNLYSGFYGADLSNSKKIKRTIAYSCARSHPFGPALSPIISGHTVVQRPFTILGQTNIDTGAFFTLERDRGWPALTCLDLSQWKFYQARPDGVTEVEPLVVSKEDVEALGRVVRP